MVKALPSKAKVVFGGLVALTIIRGIEWIYLSIVDVLSNIGWWPIF